MVQDTNYIAPHTCDTICDSTGEKHKLSEMVMRWDGWMVVRQDHEPRQPQDFPVTPRAPQVYPLSRGGPEINPDPPVLVLPGD